jgi:putative oxidoreductase
MSRVSFSRSDIGLLILRLGFASLLIGFHGWARFHKAFNYVVHGQPWTFVALVERLHFPLPAVFAVLSALAESVGAAFVGAGFLTRWAAGIVAVNMAVAFANEFSKGDPIELPALYLLSALVILVLGPGRISIDGRRGTI